MNMRKLFTFAVSCSLVVVLATQSHAQQVGGAAAGGGGSIFDGGGTGAGGGSIFDQASDGGTGSGVLRADAGNTTGGTGFLGRNNQNNVGFLGVQDGTVQGGQPQGGFGNAGGFGGRGGQQGAGNQQPQGRTSSRIVRTRITIPRDFGVRPIQTGRVQSRLNNTFVRVRELANTESAKISKRGLSGSNVTTTFGQNRTVTLRGTVKSERDRQIAEKLAKMEPGVDSVVSELVVVPQ